MGSRCLCRRACRSAVVRATPRFIEEATRMDVGEAVESRFSCRAFLDAPVAEATVRDILARAARTPSGGNVQPWHVHVLAGAPLAALKASIAARPELLPYGEGA